MNETNPLLSVLTREGVLINVSIRFWRGCKKLRAEDIGLDATKLSDRLISLGHKRLLPKDALKELVLVEGRAHAQIDGNTFPFLNGLGHFLPNPKLAEVTERLKELEGEFTAARDRFLGQYATLRTEAAREWRQMAEKLTNDPDRLVAAIEDSFPLPGSMRRFFRFDVNLFQISLPERLDFELVTVAQQQNVIAARAKAVHEAAAKIRRDTETFVQECVSSLRQQTAQLCEDMLQSIGTSDTGVHQKTLNRLVKFIDQFKAMNFADDTVMAQMLDQTRRELLSKTAEEYRDNKHAQGQLVQGLSRLRDKARELAHADASALVERFGEMGRRKFNLAA